MITGPTMRSRKRKKKREEPTRQRRMPRLDVCFARIDMVRIMIQ